MELTLLRPNPRDAQTVWCIPPGETAVFSARYIGLILFLLVPMTMTAMLGTVGFSSADGRAICSFWPAAAFQVVFSIWFGAYGAAAGIIGPMLANGLVGNSPLLYVPAYAIQSCVAGLWFRYRRLDPRLIGRRDWIELIVVGILLSQALGATAGISESYLRDPITHSTLFNRPEASGEYWGIRLLQWFAGNALPSLLLVPSLLKAASPAQIRSPFFCQRFWGGTGFMEGRHFRLRFRNLPIMAKLMILVLTAGILPLSLVAALAAWDTITRADYLAAATNSDAAREVRNEIERHELTLGMWAAEFDRTGKSITERLLLLENWGAVPHAFRELRVVEASEVLSRMPPGLADLLRHNRVGFFKPPDMNPQGDIWGYARLDSMPERMLTGIMAWRGDQPLTGRWAAIQGLLVLDHDRNVLHWDGPAELADWRPGGERDEPYIIRHGGRRWHVAESRLDRLGWRYLAFTSVQLGQAIVLSSVPNWVAALINLAIFGSIIAGSAIAGRISQRVLAIADHVREAGAEPGRLHIPVRGRDELGYLGHTLNRMSRDLAEHVRELQRTTAEKERLGAEMQLAREVQQKILPSRPLQLPGYQLAAMSHPARTVGGDFYDFFLTESGQVVLMVGDAVGKGLRAAMLITETHGLSRAVAIYHPAPDRILTAVNSTMIAARGESSDFVTMLCAILDPRTGVLSYASAGHLPAILLRNGQAQRLHLGDLPLTVSADSNYLPHQMELAPGDAIILYTDGITEAANARKDLFGISRLESAARENAGKPADEILQAILRAVSDFVGAAPEADDVTLLVLQRCE